MNLDHSSNEAEALMLGQKARKVSEMKSLIEDLKPSDNPARYLIAIIFYTTTFMAFLSFFEVGRENYPMYIAIFFAYVLSMIAIQVQNDNTNKRIDLLQKLLQSKNDT